MTGYLWAGLGALIGGPFLAVLGDMASQEIRDRLDRVPHAILHLAALPLTPNQRATIYHDEWLPELTYILKGHETQPITRLITGTAYAAGILAKAALIARQLNRTSPPETRPAPDLITPDGVMIYVKPHKRRKGDGWTAVPGHYVQIDDILPTAPHDPPATN